MKTYKYYTALIIAMAMSSCMVFAQAPVRRNTTTNRTTSTPSRKPTQRQTKPPTNATPPKQTASQPKRSQPSGYVNGHMAIDLGLSVRWADCNVGASSPEQFGRYFTFGDPTGNKYTGNYNDYPTGKIGKTEYDMAYKNWGGNWRLPTPEEIKELVTKCDWKWAYVNGIRGWFAVGTNGNVIFLPLAGETGSTGRDRYYYSGGPNEAGYVDPEGGGYGYYWADQSNECYGEGLSLSTGNHNYVYSLGYKYYGFSVRAVTE